MRKEENISHILQGCYAITSLLLAQQHIQFCRLNDTKLH